MRAGGVRAQADGGTPPACASAPLGDRDRPTSEPLTRDPVPQALDAPLSSC